MYQILVQSILIFNIIESSAVGSDASADYTVIMVPQYEFMDVKISPIHASNLGNIKEVKHAVQIVNTYFKGLVIAAQKGHDISSRIERQSSGPQYTENNTDKRKDDKLFDIFDEKLKQRPGLKLPTRKDTRKQVSPDSGSNLSEGIKSRNI